MNEGKERRKREKGRKKEKEKRKPTQQQQQQRQPLGEGAHLVPELPRNHVQMSSVQKKITRHTGRPEINHPNPPVERHDGRYT